jgi:hypothetical protein
MDSHNLLDLEDQAFGHETRAHKAYSNWFAFQRALFQCRIHNVCHAHAKRRKLNSYAMKPSLSYHIRTGRFPGAMLASEIARPRRVLAAFLCVLCIQTSSVYAEKPSHTPDAEGRIPFDVYFETTAPLGLRLDSTLRVMGFSKAADGRIAPAEEAKWILPGDSLVAVNGKSVAGVGLNSAVLAIRDASLPKVCDSDCGDRKRVCLWFEYFSTLLSRNMSRLCVGTSSTDVVLSVTWRTVRVIRISARLPVSVQVLTFVPNKPGEDRAAEMEQLVKEEEVPRLRWICWRLVL